jgi:hypothetical protein
MGALYSRVGQAVRVVLCARARDNQKPKLAAVSRAAEHSFPTADIDQMLAEIERGYLAD